jgi:hypothetical protein
MHKVQETCTADSTFQPVTVTSLKHPYSNIQPPKAYKPPPILHAHSSPSLSSPTEPFLSQQTSSTFAGSTSNEVTPLSTTIPNYLTSKHAVTRRMKTEMLNARVL